MRFVNEDAAWLSPTFNGPSCFIGIIMYRPACLIFNLFWVFNWRVDIYYCIPFLHISYLFILYFQSRIFNKPLCFIAIIMYRPACLFSFLSMQLTLDISIFVAPSIMFSTLLIASLFNSTSRNDFQ